MEIGRHKISHISLLGPILSPMKWSTLRPSTCRYVFCTDESNAFLSSPYTTRMEICEISFTPIPMVPHLHQSNGYIKGKLCVWRAQKCIALVGAEIAHTSAGPKNSRLHGGRYRSDDGKMRKFMQLDPHGTAFAPKQWLYQREATCMESLKMYCPRRCSKSTYQFEAKEYPATCGAV